MAGQPLTRLRRIRELAERAHDFANEVYSGSPERCKWEVCDQISEDDFVAKAWEAAIECAVHLDDALNKLANAEKRRTKPVACHRG